jgi:ribonuclease VapC
LTIIADASALTAMIARQPGWQTLADRLEQEPVRLVSALAAWETMTALCCSHQWAPAAAEAAVQSFFAEVALAYVTIGAREAALAAAAYAAFGRGRHPAALNMGDCFAYACAKANNADLLFIGDDFRKTDIRCAL